MRLTGFSRLPVKNRDSGKLPERRKDMKKILSIILCFAMLFAYAAVPASADGKQGTLKMLAYNVSGIPVVGDFQGSVFTATNER